MTEPVNNYKVSVEELKAAYDEFIKSCRERSSESPRRSTYKPNDPLEDQVGNDHYKRMVIQPIEYAMANGLNYCQSNAIKYISRYKNKNGAEDICKAIHTLEILLQIEYGTTYEALRGKSSD